MNQFNHNFVIFATNASPYYDYGYHDIISHPQVRYIRYLFDGVDGILSKIFRRLLSEPKYNKIICNTIGNIVYPYVAKNKFAHSKPICFLFFVDYRKFCYSGYLKFVKKKYPYSKTILYLQDLINSRSDFDINEAMNNFDEVITYDEGEAKRYGLKYYPTPMSFVDVPDDNSLEESDIYFCGKAKSRYPIIHKIYQKCSSLGLKCDFNIFEMTEEADKISGINYSKSFFTYQENLQHIKKTRCILEIMQDGAVGFTPRLWEAITYNRHILSNNEAILTSKYFIEGATHVFSDENGISEFLCQELEKEPTYTQCIKDGLSPLSLLNFLDS